MYKHEILADSLQELRAKMVTFAHKVINEESLVLNNNDYKQPTPQRVEIPVPAPVPTPTIYNEEPTEAAPAQGFQPQTTGDVDSRGFPWDARIHAATKALNKDNSWRYKRGASDDLIKEVEQELIAKIKAGHVPVSAGTVQLPTSNIVVPPSPVPTVPVAMPTFDQRNPATPWTNQAPAPVQVAPVQNYQNVQLPSDIRPAYTLKAFKDNLNILLADLINMGKIDQAYIQQLKDYFKVKEIWNVLGNEAQCIELWNMFGSPEVGFITKVNE